MRMIAVDPEQRISCEDAMQHPWFLAQIDPQAAATGPTADLRFKNAADVLTFLFYYFTFLVLASQSMRIV